MIDIVPLHQVEGVAVEALLDATFGTDRHRRTAYAVRGATTAIPSLSFAAVEENRLIGSIQCWPVTLDADDGTSCPMAMIGPVAVSLDRQGDGVGRRLMAHALAAATDTGQNDALMLIGDPDYYGRFFGFSADRTAAWRLPGPVERHRLLARGKAVPVAAGMLGPRIGANA